MYIYIKNIQIELNLIFAVGGFSQLEDFGLAYTKISFKNLKLSREKNRKTQFRGQGVLVGRPASAQTWWT